MKGHKKRRVLLVVVLIVFLLVFSGTVIGGQYTAIESSVGDADDCSEWESVESADVFRTEKSWDIYGCVDGCGWDDGPVSFPPPNGCIYSISEDDGGACIFASIDDWDCGYATIKEGQILSSKVNKLDYHGVYTKLSNDDWNLGFTSCDTKWKSGNSNAYICADDHYWYSCDKDNVIKSGTEKTTSLPSSKLESSKLGIIKIVTGKDSSGKDKYETFFCANVNNNYMWLDVKTFVEKNDEDDDKVPTPWDCNDNDDTIHGNFSAYIGPKGEPVVICGDGQLNTCGAVSGETDSCNTEYACKNNCVSEEGVCSWITTKDGKNGCCGDDGLDDLGAKGISKEGESICLNKNMVGRKGGDTTSIPGWGTECTGDWCWVPAFTIDSMFKVLTIKKPGESAYDVVSNSEEWHACDGKEKDLVQPLEGGNGDPDYITVSDRFECFKEGNHWSWAECIEKSQYNDGTIKVRKTGEGLYSLYLESAGTDGIAYGTSASGIEISTKNDDYENFYGEDTYLDFTGYTHLNFMVKFVDSSKKFISEDKLNLLANVVLQIKGPKQTSGTYKDKYIPYFDKEVLSYTVNGPLFSDKNWMHIKVPIGEFKAVRIIKIIGKNNAIAVKNVYLSKDGVKTKLCSGDDTGVYTGTRQSSWLTDIDQSGIGVTGEDLCNELYGDGTNENAWLGDYVNKKVDGPSDSCCGNNEDEYYWGKSEKAKDSNYYGCWNSQPIASGEEIMNVDFQVDYSETSTIINYPQVSFTYNVKQEDDSQYVKLCKDYVPASVYTGSATDKCYVVCEGNACGVSELYKSFASSSKETIDFKESPKILSSTKTKPLEINKSDFYHPHYPDKLVIKKLTLTSTNKEVDLYFLNIATGEKETEITPGILSSGTNKFYIMAEVNDDYQITASELPILNILGAAPETITYSCSDSECLFPLPDSTSYEITNPYPGLYDLYFVDSTKETLIDSPKKKFSVVGNLKAKKVSQQVIFINQDEDKTVTPIIKEDRGFYGCQASSFIDTLKDKSGTLILKKNLPYCSVKGDKFCSHEGSWSDDDLTQVGYKPDETIPDTFDLITKTIESGKRNQSTTAVPGRNFIPNAEFDTSSSDITNWDVFEELLTITGPLGSSGSISGGTFVKETDEKQYIGTDGISVGLPVAIILISEKIVVGKNLLLSFSQKNNVNVKIYLIDKDGVRTEVKNVSKFNTSNNVSLIIEFVGPGIVEEPMLQVVDDLGAVKYSYKPVSERDRAGAACCPENYCWNGYVCVNDMRKYSYMTEKIEEGREYRCVKGKWTYLPPQWDWNYLTYGFCEDETQCFVSGSDSLGIGSDQYTIEDIYKTGNFPICVDNKEYVFDHYCNKGNWTSRTKFLAGKLIEIAGSDDYVLYCTNYKNALVEYTSQEDKNYLGGSTSTSSTKTGPLGSTATSSTNTIQICYSGLSGTTTKEILVPKTKNTCINNVCVLKYDDGDLKTVFATSLNKDITDSKNSFLKALKVDPSAVTCPTGTGFVKCTATGLKGSLWYSRELNSTIYSKDRVTMSETGIFEKVTNWFSKLFTGKEFTKDTIFEVENASVFNELYVLNKDDKKAMVIQEVFTKKKTLIAEYENFKTPICKYLDSKNIKVPPEAGVTPLEAAAGAQKISCTKEDKTQRVVAIAGLEFLWPQLTGMLRVSE